MDADIRVMTIDDYDQVIALWQGTAGVGLDDVDGRPAIEGYLRRNEGMSFVAAEGGRIVGAVLCGTDGRRGYLHHLAVAAECRRRGVGAALVERCLAALAERGIVKCHIFAFAANVAARNFWARRGWKLREDLVVMSKDTRG
jgi:ribosomal protein S18 acetylase RimI-like enzyme